MKYLNALNDAVVVLVVLCLSLTMGYTQCDTHCAVACSGQVNLSIGQDCEAEITPWLGGKTVEVGDSICYKVEVFDVHNQIIPGNLVDISYVNQNLKYKVTEQECFNSCWGYVRIEYKQGPQIACPDDMTVSCSALSTLELPMPDNLCAAVNITLQNEVQEKLACDTLFQSVVTRTYRAVDEYGNSTTCSHDIFLERININNINFPGPTTILCSDENIVYDLNGLPLPFIYDAVDDSLDVFGLPILCTADLSSGYACSIEEEEASLTSCGPITVDIGNNGLGQLDANAAAAVMTLPCTNLNYYLSVSSTDFNISGMSVGCTELGMSTYTVYLYNGSTIVSQCTGTLEVLDPSGICAGGSTGSGSGSTGGGVVSNPTTTTGGGNLGKGACDDVFFGVPIIPNGGAIIITETGDSLKPLDIKTEEDSNTSFLCGAVMIYNDTEFPTKNSCKRKIFRTWEVFEWWCNDELTLSSVQVIEIVDDLPPELTCPSNLTISTNDDCASSISMPPVNAFDACGSEVTISMDIENDFHHDLYESNGGLVDLNAGMNVVTFTATDDCNNASSCIVNYTVIDYTNPVAICERTKVISLGSNANTKIPANIFDNGSFDDCGIAQMQVRRRTDTCSLGDLDWKESVNFCCADAVAGEAIVEFRVVDKGGNSSDCVVTVEVQDKANPIIGCPSDMTIDCRDYFDVNNLDAVFGSAFISDNCSVDVPVQLVDTDFNQCGSGILTRTIQVLGPDGDVVASCKQLVTIVNNNPFNASNIIWPKNLTVTDICDVDLLHPDLLEAPFSFPTYEPGSEDCALLGYDYDDTVYTSDPTTGQCAVIQRVWTVINWCGEAGDPPTYLNPTPQLIKIENNTSPELDEGPDLIFEGQTVDCNSGLIVVERSAVDDCQNDLIFDYTLKQFPSGNVVQKGSTNRIEGKYPVGEYTIEWRVFDGCGNFDFHIQKISVRSNKPPTPVCHNGLSATLVGWDTTGDGMIDTEQVELWANDFDAGSYPNCGNAMTFSFSQDTTDQFVIFDCNHIGRNNVNMWVTDVTTGAQAFCVAFIDIQDQGDCPDANSVVVAGHIETEMAQTVEGVSVTMGTSVAPEVTDLAGSYAFGSMPTGGAYEVAAQKDDDYLSGVSTLDLIMIQRHILGIELLDSPYRMIAADVDNNKVINGVDLVELRKLILGIYVDLPNNESWRFISSDYEFANSLDPWITNIDETYEIQG